QLLLQKYQSHKINLWIFCTLALVLVVSELRVGINPCFGEIDCKALCFLSSLESIRQAAKGMRLSFAIAFPSNLRSRAPELGALVYRRMRDNKSIIVIQVSHRIVRAWASSGLVSSVSQVRFAMMSSSDAVKSTGLPKGWGQSTPVCQYTSSWLSSGSL